MAAVTSIRFPFCFNVELLKKDLQTVLGSPWVAHYNSTAFSGSWSSVALMSEGGKSSNILATPSGKAAVTETELMKSCPYFKEVANFFNCPKTTMRLLKLDAGAEVKPHRDYALGYEDGVFRLHIPVVTNSEVEFILAGERITMEEGTCWYIDANEEHSVKNCGKEDRIHLVIDCERNEWTDELFFAQAKASAFVSEQKQQSPEEIALIIAELEKMGGPVAEELARNLRQPGGMR